MRAIRIAFLLLSVLLVPADNAGAQGCQETGYSTARCASGCSVQVRIFWNSPVGYECYKYQGDTVPCPSPCDGEYVFTATQAGTCDEHYNKCIWWVRYVATLKSSSELPLSAKIYFPDCEGNMQVWLEDSTFVRHGETRDKTMSGPQP